MKKDYLPWHIYLWGTVDGRCEFYAAAVVGIVGYLLS